MFLLFFLTILFNNMKSTLGYKLSSFTRFPRNFSNAFVSFSTSQGSEFSKQQEVDEGGNDFGGFVPFRKHKAESGHVYFVATPLGNMGDITFRAKDILETVDIIYAEDTRNTIRLLKYLSIPQKVIYSHHEHNEHESIGKIVQKVREGASVAVVSDAGTPGISDPGAPLAAAMAENFIPIHPIPGPSAVISAMSIAGFTNGDFTFYGFVPAKGTERKIKLKQIIDTKHSAVIYEAPHRMLRTFQELLALYPAVGNRYCVCCRELTKLHEEIKRDTVQNIYTWLEKQHTMKEEGVSSIGIRGEFTVVFGPVIDTEKEEWTTLRQSISSKPNHSDSYGHSTENAATTMKNGEEAAVVTEEDESITTNASSKKEKVIEALKQMKATGIKRSDAVKKVSQQLSAPRSIVYALALNIQW